MNLSSPGMTFRDAFCEQLLRRSTHNPVQWVAVPPGHRMESAVESLLEFTREHSHTPLRPLQLDLEVPETLETALLEELKEELFLETSNATSIEEFVLLNTDALRVPCTFLVGLSARTSPATLTKLLSLSERLSEISKDLEGPLSFLVLTQAPLAPFAGEASALVWEPLLPQPSFLQFSRTGTGLESQGFAIYLSYRTYWEASGRPDLLARLQEGVSASDLIGRRDADEKLEERFDELLPDEQVEVDFGALFHQHLDKHEGPQTLRTGMLGALPLRSMLTLRAHGLAWYPPGSLHAYLTPLACHALARSSLFRRSWNLREEHWSALRRQVRQNTLLASWIIGLTALIEREMLHFCRQAPGLAEALESGQTKQDLLDQQSRLPTEMMYHTRLDLIDYATFGQLQSLLFGGKLGSQFTLSQNRVNQIRHVRNLLTHLHSVRWPAVRLILQALSALQPR